MGPSLRLVWAIDKVTCRFGISHLGIYDMFGEFWEFPEHYI